MADRSRDRAAAAEVSAGTHCVDGPARHILAASTAIALVAGCASAPEPKPAMPSRPLDLQLPLEAPDETTMMRLPAAWNLEATHSTYRVETGALQGAGNFDELDGALISHYARSPHAVADGIDNERKLTTRLPSDSARPFMDAANKAFGAGEIDEALASYRQVIDRDPLYAKPYFYVADIEIKRRDLEAATAWTDRGLRLSPRDAYGYALRAQILLTSGRPQLARASLAYALALDPFSPPALKVLQSLGGTRRPGIEPPIFVQLQTPPTPPGGPPVLVARGGGHPAWQQYAVCRGLLVHDARIRGEFIQSAGQTLSPGARSLEEETTCGYLATAAYRALHGAGPKDADLERWSRAYDLNLLREAVIYETLGCRRPEVLPLLNDEALGRVVEYVQRFVLPASAPPPAEAR
jgi:tetratricopeptide (TPR) repeat protein